MEDRSEQGRPPADPAAEDWVEAGQRLIEKLRAFNETLGPEERAVLARLLGPGVAELVSYDEVEGFAMVEWSGEPLSSGIAAALKSGGITASGI